MKLIVHVFSLGEKFLTPFEVLIVLSRILNMEE